MNPTNDLFLFIKSMTPTEKRYFTIYATKHIIGKKNSYLKLYEDLDYYTTLTEEYDEKQFIKKYKSKPYIKNLAVSKNYLFEQLLNALKTAAHENETIEQQVFNLIEEIQIFEKKRLLNLWQKAIEKAKHLAEENENYFLLLKIQKLEHTYLLENKQQTLEKIADSYQQEKEDLLFKLKQQEELEGLNNWFFLQVRMYGRQQLKKHTQIVIEEKITLPILKNYKTGNSLVNDKYYLQIQQYYFYLKGEHEKVNFYVAKIYDLTKDGNGSLYSKIITTSNYLSALLNVNDWEIYVQVLNELKKMMPSNENERGEHFQNVIFYEQLLFLNQGRLVESTSLEKEINEGLKKYHYKVNTARKIAMQINLATSFFLLENWKKCDKYLTEILNEKTNARKDIKLQAKTLQLICYFEQREYTLLDYTLRNVHRSKEFEELKESPLFQLIPLLKKALKRPIDIREICILQTELISTLEKNYGELATWIEARSKKESLADVFFQNLAS